MRFLIQSDIVAVVKFTYQERVIETFYDPQTVKFLTGLGRKAGVSFVNYRKREKLSRKNVSRI